MGGVDSSLEWNKGVALRNGGTNGKVTKLGPSHALQVMAFSCMWSGAVYCFSQGADLIKMVFLKITLLTGFGIDGSREREACGSFQTKEPNRNVTK